MTRRIWSACCVFLLAWLVVAAVSVSTSPCFADESEETSLAATEAGRARARRLYFRARNYGLRGLEATHPGIDETEWKVWRMSPGFSQRFTGRFSDGGDTITGVWELCTDDIHWANDLAITYRRHG